MNTRTGTIKFPSRVWEPSGTQYDPVSGDTFYRWSSRPVTAADLADRKATAEAIGAILIPSDKD